MPRKEIYWKYREKTLATARKRYRAGGAAEREKNRLRCANWRERNRGAYNSTQTKRRKSDPERFREYDRRKYLRHRKAMNAKGRAYYQKNREKCRAAGKAYYQNNKEQFKRMAQRYISTPRGKAITEAIKRSYRGRKRKAEGSFTAAEWKSLCRLYSHLCACCRKPRKLTADHIIPLSKGGSNFIANIQPLCQPCNSAKRSRSTFYPPFRHYPSIGS